MAISKHLTKEYEETKEMILKCEKESKSSSKSIERSPLLKDAIATSIASIDRIP